MKTTEKELENPEFLKLEKEKKELITVMNSVKQKLKPAIMNSENEKLVEETLKITLKAISKIRSIIEQQKLISKDKAKILKEQIKLVENAENCIVVALDPNKTLDIRPLDDLIKIIR